MIKVDENVRNMLKNIEDSEGITKFAPIESRNELQDDGPPSSNEEDDFKSEDEQEEEDASRNIYISS